MHAYNLGKLISKQQITRMNNNQEQIWRYLSGEMALEEKLNFEQVLNGNSLLQQVVNKEQELIQFLRNKDSKNAALKNLSDIHQESIATKVPLERNYGGKSILQRPIIRWLIPIAIAATMAIGYFFFPVNQVTPQDIYAAHFEPSEISFSTRGEDNEVMLTKAAGLFNAGSYDATIEFIEKLPENFQSQDKIIYTKAISLIASQRNAEGRALLDKLPALYGDEVSWYKALSFLQEGNTAEVKITLRTISPKFNRYDSVNAILEQL
ncbi:MAG: hypothetical protein ACJA01_000264 [Saprospiraceae bacterium]|jgi:hypothetical protein